MGSCVCVCVAVCVVCVCVCERERERGGERERGRERGVFVPSSSEISLALFPWYRVIGGWSCSVPEPQSLLVSSSLSAY